MTPNSLIKYGLLSPNTPSANSTEQNLICGSLRGYLFASAGSVLQNDPPKHFLIEERVVPVEEVQLIMYFELKSSELKVFYLS